MATRAGSTVAPVWTVAFSPDGRTLASGNEYGTVKVWEVASGAESATFVGHTDGVTSVTFSPDGGCGAL